MMVRLLKFFGFIFILLNVCTVHATNLYQLRAYYVAPKKIEIEMTNISPRELTVMCVFRPSTVFFVGKNKNDELIKSKSFVLDATDSMCTHIIIPKNKVYRMQLDVDSRDYKQAHFSMRMVGYEKPFSGHWLGDWLPDRNDTIQIGRVKHQYNMKDEVRRDTISGKPVYRDVDQEAKFPGGNLAMDRYISETLDKFLFGEGAFVVYRVRAVVETDGRVTHPHYLYYGNQPECFPPNSISGFTKMILDMPRWQPAQKDGKPVRSFVLIRVFIKP